jgi:hypothetical protein
MNRAFGANHQSNIGRVTDPGYKKTKRKLLPQRKRELLKEEVGDCAFAVPVNHRERGYIEGGVQDH